MGWPQIAWIALVCISFGINLSDHGKPKTGNNNAWVSVVAVSLHVTLLYFGGFFS